MIGSWPVFQRDSAPDSEKTGNIRHFRPTFPLSGTNWEGLSLVDQMPARVVLDRGCFGQGAVFDGKNAGVRMAGRLTGFSGTLEIKRQTAAVPFPLVTGIHF